MEKAIKMITVYILLIAVLFSLILRLVQKTADKMLGLLLRMNKGIKGVL